MTELLLIAAFILFCSLAVWVHQLDMNARRTSLEAIRGELLFTDEHITTEYNRARRAMNDAVGQSWRNLAG